MEWHSTWGALQPPGIGWKYYPIQLVLGAKFALNLMRNWRASKLRVRRNLDWCLYRAGL